MDWDALIRPELTPINAYAPGLRGSDVRERTGRDTVHKLSSNENAYGPTPRAMEAMQAVLPHLNRYPDGSSRALKSRIAEHLDVDERYLSICAGTNELIMNIALALLGPGDECVYAWPSFIAYQLAVQLTGATSVKVPLGEGEVHDLPAILAAINERTKLVFLCNPNNPTGTIYSRAAFEDFLLKVPDHVFIALDEAYFEYVTSPDFPDGMKYFDGTRPIGVMRTFSKIYSLAGLRVGYGVMPEPMVSAVDKVREPFNVNMVGQIGAYYSLDDTVEVERRRRENQEQKEYLYSCFDRLGVRYVPSEANFVYVLTEKPVEVFEALLAEGVISRNFGTSKALRVGVGTPDDTEATIAAFEAAVAKLGSI
jgi:histidinol-phosphate aminotransferase